MIMGLSPKKDGVSLDALFWNPYDTAKKLSECKIGQLKVNADNKHELILQGGFKFDATVTVQDILNKYGEDAEVKESDDYKTISYEKGMYNKVFFYIYTKDEKMFSYNHVKIENLVK